MKIMSAFFLISLVMKYGQTECFFPKTTKSSISKTSILKSGSNMKKKKKCENFPKKCRITEKVLIVFNW